MFEPTTSIHEKNKQGEFLKTKIYEAFHLFVADKKKGLVDKK